MYAILPRIFLHTPEPVSSPALYVDEFVSALTASGLPVHVICPENHQARKRFEQNAHVTVHLSARRNTDPADGLLRKTVSNLRFLFSSASTLFRVVRRGDIVHFQYVFHFPFGALLFLCVWARRSRIFFTVHDPLPHKWLLLWPFHVLEKTALATAYAMSDVLLVHSDAGKRTLIRHFPRSGKKIRVIAHGPYQLPVGLPARPKTDSLEVLFFGALRENKGAHLAIEAIQQLHKAGIPVRLTIAGSVLNRKERDYWRACRQLIDKYPDPITLIERFIPDEDLAKLFARCHCFVLPYTTFSSDSGVAYMALANGRCLVSTKSGGLRDLLALSGGGLMIEKPTVSAVANALQQALALGPEYLDRLACAGRSWVLAECNWAKVARQTREIYEQLAATSRCGVFYAGQSV